MGIKDYYTPVRGMATLGALISLFTGGLVAILGGRFPTLLQVLIVSQASILAIVVSVGFLSVQITANQFTPLVTRIHKQEDFLGGVIRLYGISVFIAICMFILSPNIPESASLLRSLSVALPIYTASVNFMYLNTIKDKVYSHLDPTHLLTRLENEVDMDEYYQFISSEEDEQENEERSISIQTIYLIGIRAFDEQDIYTAKQTVNSLAKSTKALFDQYSSQSQQDKPDVEGFSDLFDYWNNLGETAITTGGEESCTQLIKKQCEISQYAISNGLDEGGEQAVKSLVETCRLASTEGGLMVEHCQEIGDVILKGITEDSPETSKVVLQEINVLIEWAIKEEEEQIMKKLWEQLQNCWGVFIEERGDAIGESKFINIGSVRPAFRGTDRSMGSTISPSVERKYDELHFEFGELAVKYFKQENLSVSPKAWFTKIGKKAATKSNQIAVSEILILMVDVYIHKEDSNIELWGSRIATIMSEGGETGVRAAFKQILDGEAASELSKEEKKEVEELFKKVKSTHQRKESR